MLKTLGKLFPSLPRGEHHRVTPTYGVAVVKATGNRFAANGPGSARSPITDAVRSHIHMARKSLAWQQKEFSVLSMCSLGVQKPVIPAIHSGRSRELAGHWAQIDAAQQSRYIEFRRILPPRLCEYFNRLKTRKRTLIMPHFLSMLVLGLVVFPLLSGCQRSEEPPKSSIGSDAKDTTDWSIMKLGVVTEAYDSDGGSQDTNREIVDATPEIVIERFNRLDWQHPSDRHHLTLSVGELNSSERKKLSINEELPEGGKETVLIANLEETPPGESKQRYYRSQPLESPEVALKLLLSFLAEDGNHRTIVNWHEK